MNKKLPDKTLVIFTTACKKK